MHKQQRLSGGLFECQCIDAMLFYFHVKIFNINTSQVRSFTNISLHSDNR